MTVNSKSVSVLKVSTVQGLLSLREGLGVYALILLVWGMYRLLFRLPTWFEETILKALVFGVPVLLIANKRQWKMVDLGITSQHLTVSVYMGVILGIILGITGNLGNILRYGGLRLSSFGLTSEVMGGFIVLALATAFWEQLLFCGMFLRLSAEMIKDEWKLAAVVAFLYVGLNLPALIFIQRLGWTQLLVAMVILWLLQLGNVILMLRYKNLAAPLMAQALWGVTVFLFR